MEGLYRLNYNHYLLFTALRYDFITRNMIFTIL
jgi:hypothetical protein